MDALINLQTAYQEHPWLFLLLTLVAFLSAIAVFSSGQLGEAISGMFRVVFSVFTAPFAFLRRVVQAMIAFQDKGMRDEHAKTLLLWRGVQIGYLGVFVAAMALLASGLTVAAAGVWPTAQLDQRKSLKTSIQEADSMIVADSTALAALQSSDAVTQARQRESRMAQLSKSAIETERLLRSTADSLNTSNGAKEAFLREVWSDVSDSNFSRARPYVQARVDSFAAAHVDDLPATDIEQIRHFIRLRITSAGLNDELSELRSAEDPADRIRQVTEQVAQDREQRRMLQEQLDAIDYFSGVKLFFTTIGLTVLLCIAFVWIGGTAVESAGLLVGMARDLSALRSRGDPSDAL